MRGECNNRNPIAESSSPWIIGLRIYRIVLKDRVNEGCHGIFQDLLLGPFGLIGRVIICTATTHCVCHRSGAVQDKYDVRRYAFVSHRNLTGGEGFEGNGVDAFGGGLGDGLVVG